MGPVLVFTFSDVAFQKCRVLWFCFPHCKSKCGLVEYVDANLKFGVGNFEFKFYYEIDDNS